MPTSMGDQASVPIYCSPGSCFPDLSTLTVTPKSHIFTARYNFVFKDYLIHIRNHIYNPNPFFYEVISFSFSLFWSHLANHGTDSVLHFIIASHRSQDSFKLFYFWISFGMVRGYFLSQLSAFEYRCLTGNFFPINP